MVDIFTIAPATRKKKRADGGRAAENDDSDDGAGPSRGRLALDDVNALVRALPVCLLVSMVLTVPQSSPEVTKAASALRRIHQPDISGRRYYTPSHWLDQSRVLDLDRPFVLELWAKSIVRSPRGSSQRAQSQPRAGLRPLRLHQLRLRQRLLCLLSFGRHRSAVSLEAWAEQNPIVKPKTIERLEAHDWLPGMSWSRDEFAELGFTRGEVTLIKTIEEKRGLAKRLRELG